MSELGKALHGFQAEAPSIHLDGTGNFQNKFASLPNVVATVRPILNKHGLVYLQLTTNIDGAPALETMLIHAESGEDIAAVTPLILGKNDPQGYGSALTYARRYALLSILGLVGDEDDDANSAVSAQRGDGSAERPSSSPASGSDGFGQAPRDLEFTFGKHKGKTIKQIDEDEKDRQYLEWWLTSDSAKADKNQELRSAVELHLGLTSVIAAGDAPDDTDGIPF